MPPPPSKHTLRVKPTTRGRARFGDLLDQPLLFEVTEEEMSKTEEQTETVTEEWRDPWTLAKSIWVPRKQESDARD